MSKGLGSLQREILAHIADPMPRGQDFSLRDGVYDLRFVLRALQKLRGGRCISESLQAAFSRAVRSLVRRRFLKPLWLVPINCTEQDREWLDFRTEELSDGLYMIWSSRRVRFVQLTSRGTRWQAESTRPRVGRVDCW